MFERLNAGHRQRSAEEMAVMRELPERRMESAKRERVKVDSSASTTWELKASRRKPALLLATTSETYQ
jgi:hypothetical protein